MKLIRTRSGARLVEAGTIVSEILREPGPSHSLFDVLAAAVAALTPGPRVLLLGFAGGGLVAPLRAMGFDRPIDAVDLSLEGAAVFRAMSGRWAGEVRIHEAEASAWVRRHRSRLDLVVEDLFLDGAAGMAKPEVSRSTLPPLLAHRLGSQGVLVVNVLPESGRSWSDLVTPLVAHYRERCCIRLDDYENRLMVAGDRLGGAREVSGRLRAALRGIGSRQARKLSVASS